MRDYINVYVCACCQMNMLKHLQEANCSSNDSTSPDSNSSGGVDVVAR